MKSLIIALTALSFAMKLLFFSVAMLAAAAGCDTEPSSSSYPWEIRPGEIKEFVSGAGRVDTARVDINGVPVAGSSGTLGITLITTDTVSVQAGMPFDVTVYTFSIGPCHRPSTSDIDVAGRVATIAVYDSVAVGGVCIATRTYTPRTDRVTISSPGAGEVVIRGVVPDHITGEHPEYVMRFPIIVTE